MPKIIGFAVDSDTGFPIGNTRIDIKNDESYRTSTDSSGKFYIEVEPGKYEISLHSRVYKSSSVDVLVEDSDVEVVIESEKKSSHR